MQPIHLIAVSRRTARTQKARRRPELRPKSNWRPGFAGPV